MSNGGSPGLRIVLGLIAAAAIVIAAIIAAKCGKTDGIPQDISYAGRVIDNKTQELIPGATVFIDTKGGTQRYSTDSNGIYKVLLSPDIKSVHIRVEATGYKIFDSNVSPATRDQIEDVRLQRPDDAFGINLPAGMTLKRAIEFVASQDRFGVQYTGKCDPRLMQAEVRSGEYDGKHAGEVIDQLKNRLVRPPTTASYQVTRIEERKVYQIACTN